MPPRASSGRSSPAISLKTSMPAAGIVDADAARDRHLRQHQRFDRVVFEQLIHHLARRQLPKSLELFSRGFGVEVFRKSCPLSRGAV